MMDNALQFASTSMQYYSFISNAFNSEEDNFSKITGRFYTHPDICKAMATSVIENAGNLLVQQRITIIDPFCGDGRLVIALIKEMLSNSRLSPTTQIDVTLWDIDAHGVQTAQIAVTKCLSENQRIFSVDTAVGDSFLEYENASSRFDICVTNPPWCILKPANYSKSTPLSQDEKNRYETVTAEYGKTLKRLFPSAMPSKTFGRWGINLSRCGLDACVSLLKESGVCGIVMPATFFSDQVSTELRKKLYEHNKIHEIHYYPAEAKLFGDADQTSITIVFSVGQSTTTFSAHNFIETGVFDSVVYGSNIQKYISENDYTIPFGYSLGAMEILTKLAALPKLSEYPGIWIGREIDETRIAERLTGQGTFAFKKGYMVFRYSCEDDLCQYLVDGEAIPDSALHEKIVWRDVSRATQKRRIKATLLPQNTVAGNSLGVISLQSDSKNHLYWILALLNSYVAEFQARRRLITNHVPAGVVRDIPMPILDETSEIDVTVCKKAREQICDPQNVKREAELECLAAKVYGLTMEEFFSVLEIFDIPLTESELLKESAKKVWQSRNAIMIPNHYAAKMSALDKLIINHVPQGGNWKNIPESVPSQRLLQIRESFKAGKGSRSTYYGRLREEMPAYTISTYFNRPGNGCNIHYAQNRTISQREAARLQSFPDDFAFYGSKSAVNDQIGNAVPPLLAYQIASALPFKGQYVDLFCGAGGLSLGFLWAGWTPVIANDINADAVQTHKNNIPEDAICGDITDDAIISHIVACSREAMRFRSDLPLFVIGGPPCQGFSTANCNRSTSDQRNWLFKAYSNVVAQIEPAGFVFENVTGILNFDGGKFFEIIKGDLKKSVTAISMQKFNCAEFGIPQRRERIIIIGSTQEVVEGFKLIPITKVPPLRRAEQEQMSLCLGGIDLPDAISAKAAIDDLPPIADSEDGSYLPYATPPQNDYQRLMRGEIKADEYIYRLIQR